MEHLFGICQNLLRIILFLVYQVHFVDNSNRLQTRCQFVHCCHFRTRTKLYGRKHPQYCICLIYKTLCCLGMLFSNIIQARAINNANLFQYINRHLAFNIIQLFMNCIKLFFVIYSSHAVKLFWCSSLNAAISKMQQQFILRTVTKLRYDCSRRLCLYCSNLFANKCIDK